MGKLAVVLILLLTCPVMTFVHEVKCIDISGPIFIKADGSIDPLTAPIQRDGNIYTLTDDLNIPSVIIQRSNTILDGANKTISGRGAGTESDDGIVLSANNITIRNITVTETRLGINLSPSTSYGNITECNVQKSWIGIWLRDTYGNTVSENQIDDTDFGIYLINSSSNDITLNDITAGLELVESSSNNKIVGNNIGTLSLDPSSGPFSVNNSIYHNRIGDVEVGPWSPQIWDDGYPSGGNLWVGYYGYQGFDFHSGPYQNETGSDGIGDTPYVMDENNTDRYPWMMIRTSTPVLPVAEIETYAPSPLKVDDIVIFNASRSVCGWNGTHASPIKEYIWDFGDGNKTSTNERAIEHSFGSAMSFRIWLTVVDVDGENSSTFTVISAVMPTSISISTTSPSSFIGFAVGINGRLQDFHWQGLSNKTILLSYTFLGAPSWVPITSSLTDDFGQYSAQWIPTATGYFTIKVEWAGNQTHFGANSTIALSTLPYENQFVFTVESNSTISDLTFDSNSHRLSFVADGENATTGYTKVTIAKNLAPDITKLKVHLDKTEYEYTVMNMTDSWVLFFAYNHSIHQIEIDLGQPPIPEFPSFLMVVLFMVGTVLAVIAYKKKYSENRVSGSFAEKF